MAWPRDRAKFEREVREHLPAALRFAVRLTGSLDAAEDLTQDALLRASRGWKSFRGDSEFRTWLFRIVINVFRDRQSRGPVTQELTEGLAGTHEKEGPVDWAMAHELQGMIARHVSQLPPRQREVIVLSAYEGMSPREIAAVLEISEANVHATLYAARHRLRRQLEPYFADE
jgi:RNA polymerase sigma-70 factor (ECF subfamily)